nr:phospholipase D-like domain-containing protein [Verrucomicrobiota bacterium]
NFTSGGVFGHSNVVHIVEEPEVAKAYLSYWEAMKANPRKRDLAPVLEGACVIPAAGTRPPEGTSLVFSPRSTSDALEFYRDLAASAEEGLFMTFAFGMHPLFKEVYRDGKTPLRYALMEKLLGPGQRTEEQEREAREEMQQLRNMDENRFAVGGRIALNELDGWVLEKNTGLNKHVNYIHTKYLLVDPLGRDPIVVTGSANFSEASSTKNDENMMVIRGNERVAHIYLGEFMRLWDHYAFREFVNRPRPTGPPVVRYLDSGDDPENPWWKKHFDKVDLSRRREYFSR